MSSQTSNLWADKYRPKALDKLDYHKEQAVHLKNLVQQGDFPHMLFYGPNGAGKRTRIMALLRELYGTGADRLRMERVEIQTPSNKKIEIKTIASNYHIEINASDAGIYDRIVVMEIIKNVAQTHQLDSSGQRDFKVIILTEVDHLTKEAQQALRRTMEKYVSYCRLIMCANSSSRVIPAIRSRCLGIRIPAPTVVEIVSILQYVCKKEGIFLPSQLAERIAEFANGNLRVALLSCETCKVMKYPFENNQKIVELDWQVYIAGLADVAVKTQSPDALLEVRNRLYELLSHGLPADVIFKHLLKELLKKCPESIKKGIVENAAEFEHAMHSGSKVIFYMEAFVAQVMHIYAKNK